MRNRSAASFLPLLLLLAPAFPRAAFAATVPGEEWEVTTKMTMEGMPMQMPARTSTVCRPKVNPWNEPPMDKASQERCKIAAYQLAGNHATWKMTCEGGMSGTGEITYQPDSYQGTMSVTMDQGSMRMELSGRRTGKACDAEELKKTIERAQKQADDAVKAQADAMAAACRDGAASANYHLFVGANAQCKSADQKAAFCGAVKTAKGFNAVSGANDPLAEVMSFCGTSADAIKKDLCSKAVADKQYTFMGRNCPSEAKTFAQANCAGRKFTSIPDESVQGFCVMYAEKLLEGK
jgi:uncharacterized protein DUF3617